VRETADKTTTETAYYLLNAALPPERFNQVVRQHWGVENRLHWRLDVVVNEDQDRTRLGLARKYSTGGVPVDSLSWKRAKPRPAHTAAATDA